MRQNGAGPAHGLCGGRNCHRDAKPRPAAALNCRWSWAAILSLMAIILSADAPNELAADGGFAQV